jgi:hypothetical protein
LHYFDNTTAPLLILQDNNDPRRRPSPCGEGSVRYMRAFTKAAIVAAVAAVVAAAVLALVSVAKAVATEASLEITVAAAQAMQKESSSGAREAAPSYKPNHATRQPLPLAAAFCEACRWESRIMTYVKLRAPQGTRHPKRFSASSGGPGCSQGKKRVFKTGSNLTTIASSSCSHNLRFCSYG